MFCITKHVPNQTPYSDVSSKKFFRKPAKDNRQGTPLFGSLVPNTKPSKQRCCCATFGCVGILMLNFTLVAVFHSMNFIKQPSSFADDEICDCLHVPMKRFANFFICRPTVFICRQRDLRLSSFADEEICNCLHVPMKRFATVFMCR